MHISVWTAGILEVAHAGAHEITCFVLHETAGLFTAGRNGAITWWNVRYHSSLIAESG